MVNQKEIIEKTAKYVRHQLRRAEGGHGWDHVRRVWKTALYIARREKADLFVVQLAALLHDIADWKFCSDESLAGKKIRNLLLPLRVSHPIVEHVVKIVENVSFKGSEHRPKFMSPEFAVVQDADRLDALGAIGIARLFHYGGHIGQVIHDPQIKPKKSLTAEEYAFHKQTSINHFYEKLLLLKDRMNTATARRIAVSRDRFVREYLKQFLREYDGSELT